MLSIMLRPTDFQGRFEYAFKSVPWNQWGLNLGWIVPIELQDSNVKKKNIFIQYHQNAFHISKWFYNPPWTYAWEKDSNT